MTGDPLTCGDLRAQNWWIGAQIDVNAATMSAGEDGFDGCGSGFDPLVAEECRSSCASTGNRASIVGVGGHMKV